MLKYNFLGFTGFCPLGKFISTVHEYIKDNTMFIKIIVDTKDLTEVSSGNSLNNKIW